MSNLAALNERIRQLAALGIHTNRDLLQHLQAKAVRHAS